MLKKIKDALLGLFAWAVLVSIIPGCTYFNLKSNSVYYAQHTPHKEGCEPALMMLVDNLWWISTPAIEGITYEFDGGMSIHNYNYRAEDVPWFAGWGEEEYIYGSSELVLFAFNKKFELVYVDDKYKGSIDSQSIDVKKVKKEIYKVVQPVIDAQSKPWINLRWLFDIVYHDRFN